MNSTHTWLSAIFLLLFACFILLLGILITGCAPAWGDETAHELGVLKCRVDALEEAHFAHVTHRTETDTQRWSGGHVAAAFVGGLAIGVFVGLAIGVGKP